MRLHHIIDHLYNIFLENDGSENCAQLLEEEVNKMFGTKYLNDEHDCNVVSMNSMNIQNTNDDCTSRVKNVSYKHVNFCGVHKVCEDMPYREDRFCKKHKHDRTNFFLKVIDEFATKLCSLCPITCELCNKVGHLNFQCMLFHDRIVSKYCNNLITFELFNELCLFLGCEERSHKNSWFEAFVFTDHAETTLKEIYMFCVVNCNENAYIANYKNMGNH